MNPERCKITFKMHLNTIFIAFWKKSEFWNPATARKVPPKFVSTLSKSGFMIHSIEAACLSLESTAVLKQRSLICWTFLCISGWLGDIGILSNFLLNTFTFMQRIKQNFKKSCSNHFHFTSIQTVHTKCIFFSMCVCVCMCVRVYICIGMLVSVCTRNAVKGRSRGVEENSFHSPWQISDHAWWTQRRLF